MTSLLSTSHQNSNFVTNQNHFVQQNSLQSSGRHLNQICNQQQFLVNTDSVHPISGSTSRNSTLGKNKSTRHDEGGGRNSVLRVPQYTLNNVKFVEELGEGAFGKYMIQFYSK